MVTKIVKLTFEDSEGGKYKFYTTAEQIKPILDLELFTMLIIDAKTGEQIVLKEKITSALKMNNEITENETK